MASEMPPSRQRVILDFGMTLFSGMNDEYQNEFEFVDPLSSDKASGNRTQSCSRLFQLPVELLESIAKYIPSTSALSNFALTCHDACALARTQQFANVLLDYSPRSLGFLVAILKEARERKHLGYPKLPSISACVRKLTVATSAVHAYNRHHVHLRSVASLDKEDVDKRLLEGAEFYYGPYLGAMASAIEFGLPNLAILRWHDMVVVPSSILKAICCSPAKDVTLFRIQVDESFDLAEHLTLRGATFSLRALDFTLSWTLFADPKPPTGSSLVKGSLLCLCAPTLERLSWSAITDKSGFHLPASRIPPFANLRELRLSSVSFDDPGYYLALIPKLPDCRIRILEVNPDETPAATEFFRTRGRIGSLRTFVWPMPPRPEESRPLERGLGGITFLQANTQIEKLRLGWQTHPNFLDNRILPLVANSFDRLTSLSLVWGADHIPPSSLQMLSRITALEQLHISAGCQIGWRHSWLISHRVLRESLEPLQKLRVLAIGRDSYNPGFTRRTMTKERFQECVDRYYSDKLTRSQVRDLNEFFRREDVDGGDESDIEVDELSVDVDEDDETDQDDNDPTLAQLDGRQSESDSEDGGVPGRADSKALWERQHMSRILVHAAEYFESFPNLEHLYVGQLPIKRGLDVDGDRDDCYTWLQMTFGWPYKTDS
jgi:hypothetical protein